MKWLMLTYWIIPFHEPEPTLSLPALNLEIMGYFENEAACKDELDKIKKEELPLYVGETIPLESFEGPLRSHVWSFFDYTSVYTKLPDEEFGESEYTGEMGVVCIKSGCDESGCKKPDEFYPSTKSRAIVVPSQSE